MRWLCYNRETFIDEKLIWKAKKDDLFDCSLKSEFQVSLALCKSSKIDTFLLIEPFYSKQNEGVIFFQFDEHTHSLGVTEQNTNSFISN